ncbi:MAG: MFS transporter [Chloroflexota bacterium]
MERVRQRIVLALFASQSLLSAAMIAAFTLTPVIAADLGGGERAAGVPSTLNLLGRAAVAYPMGWLMDRAGRRPGLAMGYLLGALGAAVSALAVTQGLFPLFLVGAGLIGAARGSAEQSRFIAAEVQTPDRQARVMGLIVFAGTIGAVGGPLLVDPSGRLVGRLGLAEMAGPFVAAAALILLAFLTTVIWLRPDPRDVSRTMALAERPAATDATVRSKLSLRILFRGARVQLAVGAMLIGQLTMTALMVITPLHMAHHNHETGAIAWVIMAHTLGMFGLSSATGWLIDRFGRISMVVAGTALLLTASVLAPVSTSLATIALALFILGLGWNFCFIAGSSLLSDQLGSEERGRAQGASEVLVALASGVGSLGTGVLFEYRGITAVGLLGVALAVVLLGLVARVVWPRRAEVVHEPPLSL